MSLVIYIFHMISTHYLNKFLENFIECVLIIFTSPPSPSRCTNPSRPTQLYFLCFFFIPLGANLWCLNSVGCLIFHWSFVHLLGAIILKRIDPPSPNWQLTIAPGPAPISMLWFCLVWVYTDLEPVVTDPVSFAQLPCYVQKTRFPPSYQLALPLSLFYLLFPEVLTVSM